MDNKKPSGRQIAAARTLIGMTQPDLARRANISVPTLKRMEASEGPALGMANNVAAVRAALELAGVIFVEENGEGPGVRLRKGMQRQLLEKAKIQTLCIDALRRCATLSNVVEVEVVPRSDKSSWTWDVSAVRVRSANRDITRMQWEQFGEAAIRQLQQEYDLKE